jgi:hypothetical protein
MKNFEQMHTRAADHYRLAFVLTGEREISPDATLEALDTASDPNWSFAAWMSAWSRRLVIAKVLSAIRGELAESARRTVSLRLRNQKLLPGSARLRDGPTPAQLERALLAIDVFPRCALILTVFEGISVEDAAVLLDATVELLRKARTFALTQLLANLRQLQTRTSGDCLPLAMSTAVQHA